VKTILVIEDDAALLRLEQTVLRAAGYTVEAVADGAQARTKLKATPYHGIVLDLTVPGGDGYGLAQEIGGLGANRNTPLIILGSDEPKARQRAFDAGAMAFLPKPFTTEAFRSVIHSVVSPAGPPLPGAPRAPSPRASTPVTFAPPSPADEPALEEEEAVVAEGSLPVSYQGGPVYWCAPDGQGGWRCARCEMGTIRSPEVGSTCSVCQAAVALLKAPSRVSLGWLIALILLGLLTGWAVLTWWE